MVSPPMFSSVTQPSNLIFDENRWIINVRRTLEDDLEDDTDIPVCIFSVPKTLMTTKPEAYIPQQVALGPYHNWRPELYETERYKLSAAKRTQKQLQTLKFQNLVDQLVKLEPRIRGCYHKYLDFNGETLAWMMAVDASFLLEFLQTFAVNEGKILRRVSSRMSHLVDYTGRKSSHNIVLCDILLLENQIPLFVLIKILEVQYQSREQAHEVLNAMLFGLCKEISPFNVKDNLPSMEVMECAHLLDFVYHMIVPRSEQPCEIDQIDDRNELKENEGESFGQPSHVQQLFSELWGLLSKLNKGPISYIKSILVSRPLKLVAKLPWTIITRLPGFALLKQPVQYFFSHDKDESDTEKGSSLKNENRPPLIEEITIPSVTELHKSGVRFAPTNNDITNINFDASTITLYLPTVSLDVNTEVVLRNLVAYEASSAHGPLVITRYTELMNGIIDTAEDAKLLREKGIVLNRLKSDGEVADLWNGMSKSVKLTRVPFLDKVIEDVNKYYSCRWKVKLGKYMKVYVFGSWQFLTLLAAIFLLLLMALQAFCSVYSCSRFLRVKTSQ